MARAATPLPTFHCFSENRSALLSLPPSISLITGNPRYSVCGSVSRFALASLSPWSGLKRLTISYQKNYSRRGSKEKCRGRVVYASLFGVGAPEVLVIGVVALLVFGPKGLAEVARNLGKTLRAFQPTIRELQEVSREFKSTLEREIGLDEAASPMNNAYKSISVVDDTPKPSTSVANETPTPIVDPNGSPTTAGAYTSEEVLKITEEQLVTASETGPQSETSHPQEQIQDSVATPIEVSGPEVAATPAAPEAASQAPTTEKAKNER